MNRRVSHVSGAGRIWRYLVTFVVCATGMGLSTIWSGAAGAAAAKPSVAAFKASVKKVAAAGGEVTLMISTRNATKCELSVKPAIKGLPVAFSCARKNVSRKVGIQKNLAASTRTYGFRLLVTGKGGAVRSGPVNVVQAEAAPDVALLSVQPSSLPSFGGKVTVVAHVSRAVTCQVSVSPALVGFPASASCKSGTMAISATIPALASPTSPSVAYRFMVSASGPGGRTVGSPTVVTAWSTLGFGSPAYFDNPTGTPLAVSCASSSFCDSVDYFGNVIAFNGSEWAAPRMIDTPSEADPPAGVLRSISCPTVSFCAAVDQDGNALIMSGSSWTAPTAVATPGNALVSVSCSTPTFCVAVGGDDVATWNGTTWTWVGDIDPSSNLDSISCPPGSSVCEAVEYKGAVEFYSGTTWTETTGVDSTNDLVSVSCPATTFCAAVDSAGNVVLGFPGATSWTWSASVDPNGLVEAVSCASSVFCVAVDWSGDAITWDGDGPWTSPAPIESVGGLISISCLTASFCVAVDEGGRAVEFNGTGWHMTEIDPVRGGPSAISCPSTNSCTAVDENGATMEFNGTSWTTPTLTLSGVDLTSVSCPTSSFCAVGAAVSDEEGEMLVESDGEWSASIVSSGPITAVSCPTPNFCGAVYPASYDDGLYWVTWNGKIWSTPQVIDDPDGAVSPAPGAGAISCLSSTFCVAVANGGYAYVYNGSFWSARDAIDVGTVLGLQAVSCATATFCEAIDGWGQAFTYNGSSWLGPTGVAAGDGMSSISCPAAGFCVAVDVGGDAYTDVSGVWSGGQDADPGVPMDFGFTGVSCASVAFCVATDLTGQAVRATG
ncbi:MAG: hypothetical protein ABR925_01455 [Acidimicrobiales bacterium]|jgi:hypothetical protein